MAKSIEKRLRKFFWWQTGVDRDQEAEVGGRMIKATLIWYALLVVLVVIVGIIVAVG